ncbi:MAG: lytR [Phenylobacterium sp.]|nr:lytR [Phenylobacterium sp.]
MLRVLIVDDEPLARRRLDILLKAIPDVEVAGAAPDGLAARRMIGELRPDVMLLDIKMPGLNGFELLDALPAGTAPIVIFVTAFDRFAVEAFKRAAFDYLLKPVEPERLRAAIARAREALATQAASERVRELEEIIGNLRQGPDRAAPRFDREVWVQDRNDRLSLPVAAIDWVGAERDYVRIHTGGRSYLVRQALGGLGARLDPAAFQRIHRSSLVKLDRIVRLRSVGGKSSVVLSTGAELAVSRRCVAKLKAMIGARG